MLHLAVGGAVQLDYGAQVEGFNMLPLADGGATHGFELTSSTWSARCAYGNIIPVKHGFELASSTWSALCAGGNIIDQFIHRQR